MSQALVTGGGAMAGAICAGLRADGYEIARFVELGTDERPPARTVDFADDAGLVMAIDDLHGPIDALVVSHAHAETGSLHSTTPAAWRHVLDINLNSTFTVVQAVLRRLTPGGSIVLVSSTAGLDRSKNSGPHYTAAKAGVNALVRHLAEELGRRGIRINAVCAGLVEDELAAAVNTEATFAEAVAGIPLGRPGSPEEIAQAVRFLISDDASYMTGAILTVAGGTHR